MKLVGDKQQKRVLPERRLKDIKMEVGEDTGSLLRNIRQAQRKESKPAPKALKQVSLVESETKPQPKLSDANIICVKRKPDLKNMMEVRDLPELRKVEREFKFINFFEDEKEAVYFVGDYFFRAERKK